MPPRRLILLSACVAFAALLAACWATARTADSNQAALPLQAGEALAVDVHGDTAAFDLAVPPDARYAVIVASLGNASQSYGVTLQAEPINKAGPLRGRRITPPRPNRTRRPPVERGNFPLDPPTPHRASANSPLGPSAASATSPATSTRTFFLHVTDGPLEDPNQYACVVGRCIGEGRSARIFLDQQLHLDQLTPQLVDELVRICDRVVLPRLGRTLGVPRDVDGDGKLTLLMTPWLGRLQGGRTSLGGFVRPTDFRPTIDAPFSNACDMLYLNSTLQPGGHLETLIAHEYTHAVCCSARASDPSAQNEEDWLNEAIAHVAEGWAGADWSNLDYRISRYLNAPSDSPLVVRDYFRAGMWRDHGCRGATFLFLNWLVDEFGDASLSKLIHSRRAGTRNLEGVSGKSFDELFRRWTISLLLEPRPRSAVRPSSSQDRRVLPEDGSIGRFLLVGPRPTVWNLERGSCRLTLKGTAAHFVELRPSTQEKACRIRVDASPGARLQVTLVRLDDGLPRLDVDARWTQGPSPSTLSAASARPAAHLEIAVRITDGELSHFETIAVEQNADERRRAEQFNVRQSAATAGPASEARFELAVAELDPAETPAVVKVLARDRQGRRVVGWATVEPLSLGGDSLQVANALSPADR